MNPRSDKQARQQVIKMMWYEVSGLDRKEKKKLLNLYALIIEVIWRHWQAGIYNLRPKHIKWYFEAHIDHRKAGTKYRYWRRIRELLVRAGKYERLKDEIRGPWCTPDGRDYTAPLSKAGRKPNYLRKKLTSKCESCLNQKK